MSLLELASRPGANGGVWRPVRWRDDGAPSREEGRRVISAEAAAQVLDVLADPVARLPGFGAFTPLEFAFRAAAKTGTSRHFTDNWAVVTTAGFTVAVWAGNFSGRPMAAPAAYQRRTAGSPRRARRDTPAPTGSLPTIEADLGLVPIAVCQLSRLAASPRCPAVTEWFRRGTEPGPDSWFGPDGITLPADFADWATQRVARRGGLGGRPRRDRFSRGRLPDHFAEGWRPAPGRSWCGGQCSTVGLRAAGGGRRGVKWFVDGKPHPGGRWQLAK
ncbi:MAG: hypothetical protein R2882_07830 [Gemmatimonadales bacterium]